MRHRCLLLAAVLFATPALQAQTVGGQTSLERAQTTGNGRIANKPKSIAEKPLARIPSRLATRIEARLQTRLDANYQSDRTTTDAITKAARAARGGRPPR